MGGTNGGRPSKFSLEIQEAVCKTLQYGVDVETACRREGISQATYYRWRKQGEEGTEPFASFLAATEQAMSTVEMKVTAQILRASQTQWQAGAWWLRFRKTGGKQQVELTGPNGQPITGTLSPETAEQIRQHILYGSRAELPENTRPGQEEAASAPDGTEDPDPEA